MLVLDEADEMLNKGFKEQIYDVYRYLPPATQVIKEISSDIHYGHDVSLQENVTHESRYLPFVSSCSEGGNDKPSRCCHIY